MVRRKKKKKRKRNVDFYLFLSYLKLLHKTVEIIAIMRKCFYTKKCSNKVYSIKTVLIAQSNTLKRKNSVKIIYN